MDKGGQLQLPKFRGIKRLKKKRKLPQPKASDVRAIKKFEFLHRPFDLRFRGAINKWLEFLKAGKNIEIEKVLDDLQQKIINLYFYPQGTKSKWLNQEEVLKKVKLNAILENYSKKKLKKALVKSLLSIWAFSK